MATDGVKIIDGDTAHDTYWGIMDLYDNGATIETIREKMPFPESDSFDDFEYEIYTTAYALAFWEIGFITDDIIEEVQKVIEKGACVEEWTEECDEKTGKARQKELDKLWKKINSPNTKIRKRKKFKKVKKFIFDINDVLIFQLLDTFFYVTIVLDVKQYRGECDYYFGKIVFKESQKPTIQDIVNCDILGYKIPSSLDLDAAKLLAMSYDEIQNEGGFDAFLKKEAEKTPRNYSIGLEAVVFEHSHLTEIAHNFQKIGNLKLNEIGKQIGSYFGGETIEDFTWDLKNSKGGICKIVDLLEK